MITEKSIKELEGKIKDKQAHREQIKRYKKLRFEYNHPLLFKIKELLNRNKIL